MNNPFAKLFLGWGFFLVLALMNGCAETNQASPAPTANSTVAVTVTVTVPPSLTSTPTLEITTTPTVLPIQPNFTAAAGKASFVRENYPDNSVLKPGEKFVKTFEIKNAGNIPWTTAYSFVLDTAHQNETLDSPAQINLPQETQPGGTVSLSIPLTAPTTPGTYTVYWTLKNESGGTILIDGGPQVWVKIIVCNPNQSCKTPVTGGGTSVTANGVTATLTSFTHDTQSATVEFCMNVPNRYYALGSPVPSLLIDQKPAPFLDGGTIQPWGCYFMKYQISAVQFEQAQHIVLSIDSALRMTPPGAPNDACQAAKPGLIAKYPGLDFQCNFSGAGYYTNLQLPDGMTETQAQKIIFDTIEVAIYGPWVLVIR